jgi:type I restriction enzyme M protein
MHVKKRADNRRQSVSQSMRYDIWKLIDSLRGELRAADIRVPLAALIYLRWVDFQEAEQIAIAAFEEIDYEPVLPDAFQWRSWHVLPSDELKNFISSLPEILNNLGNTRKNPLATYLHRIAPAVQDLTHLSAESLKSIVTWLSEQPFETLRDRRALLDTYDDFLELSEAHNTSEFRTPTSIARLLAELARPQPEDRIYDPCFGAAGLLTMAYEHVLRNLPKTYRRGDIPILNVYGIELNNSVSVIGIARLALAGIESPQLESGNSLERKASDNHPRDGYDIILADPPWGQRINKKDLEQGRFSHYAYRTSDTSSLFIQHALQQLKPGGRMVIVVPLGVLFRKGVDEQFRKMLIEQYTIISVIALPATSFLPYTAIPSSALVIQRGEPTQRIRMVDAGPFFKPGKTRSPATIENSPAEDVANLVHSAVPGDHSWDVEVESLEEINWDLSPKRRDQNALVETLEPLKKEVAVVSLHDCCEIFGGRSIKSADLSDDLFQSSQDKKKNKVESISEIKTYTTNSNELGETYSEIPYIRIKDIQYDQVIKGSSWLTADSGEFLRSEWKLRSDDVLLSRSGTIGKAGVVRKDAVGGVAASGLLVLRPEPGRLNPLYLLAYLSSDQCRAWLEDNARGATIRHLSIKVLKDLPMPLPSMQIQERVAIQCRDYEVDTLVFLTKLLIKGEDDPIAEWITDALRFLRSERASMSPGDIEFLLHQKVFGDLFQNIRNRSAHQKVDKHPLAEWILSLTAVVEKLQNIVEVPAGPGLYSLLQQALQLLRNAGNAIGENMPSEAKVHRLQEMLEERVDTAMEQLVIDIRLTVSCSESELRLNIFSSVDLIFENKGSMPLLNLHFKTSPDWGQGQVGYLAESSTKTVAVSGTTPWKPGEFSFRIQWSALSLGGNEIHGEREVAFSIVESDESSDQGVEFGGSPYVCGDPIRPDRSDVFFGREDLLYNICRQVMTSGNVVLLEGNRRSGKSSILRHLEGPRAVPGWLSVYCSLQGAEGSRDGVGVPTAEIFREIAKSIAQGFLNLDIEILLPNGKILPPKKRLGIAKACREGIGEDAPFSDLRDYIETVLEILEQNDMGLLLMLDEFDKLQEGIDNGVTSPQVPENIRFLVQAYPRFSAVLTGSRRLRRLREEYWSALYGLGTRFAVTALPDGPARRLIVNPVKRVLTYAREAVDRALFLTSGQPYLLQLLCNRIYDIAVQLRIRSITLDLVNQASNVLVEDNEHFASLWGYAHSDRRRFLLSLCHREMTGPDSLRLGVIQERLINYGIEIGDEELIEDLEFLRELELIELKGESSEGYYELAIPLMGIWIDKQQDFNVILTRARAETEDQYE